MMNHWRDRIQSEQALSGDASLTFRRPLLLSTNVISCTCICISSIPGISQNFSKTFEDLFLKLTMLIFFLAEDYHISTFCPSMAQCAINFQNFFFFSFLKSLTHLKPLKMFSFFRNDNDEVLMLFLAVAVGYHISSLFLLEILAIMFQNVLKFLDL